MPVIHPTAIVSPEATLADDVVVGPWALIEAGAVIGAGCHIGAHAVVEGVVRLGKNNKVGYGAILGAVPQDFSFQPGDSSTLIIGDNNVFREYVTLHRGTKEGSSTTIGNNNFLMVGVHVGHNAVLGNHIVIANNCLIAGHVQIEDRVVLGGGAVFHQFIRIGTLAMVRGGSRISKNIPPYVMAYESDLVSGLNAVGLKRAGFSSALRLELRRAFQQIYRQGLNVTQALEAAAQKEWSLEASSFFEFIVGSQKRGICHTNKAFKKEALDALDS